jgi:hypothetical protein
VCCHITDRREERGHIPVEGMPSPLQEPIRHCHVCRQVVQQRGAGCPAVLRAPRSVHHSSGKADFYVFPNSPAASGRVCRPAVVTARQLAVSSRGNFSIGQIRARWVLPLAGIARTWPTEHRGRHGRSDSVTTGIGRSMIPARIRVSQPMRHGDTA